MIIRAMSIQRDALALLEAAEEAAPRMEQQALLPETLEELQAAFKKILTSDIVETFVVEHEDRLVAALGIAMVPYLWNPKRLMAEQVFWWAAEDAPFGAAHSLFEMAMSYCMVKGAVPLFMAPAEPDGRNRLFQKRGLRAVQTVYVGLS